MTDSLLARRYHAALAAGLIEDPAALRASMEALHAAAVRQGQIEPTEPTEHVRGPWVAVLSTEDGLLLDGPDELGDDDCADVSVVRGTAAPVNGEMPASHAAGDVLYESSDLWHDTYDPSVSVDARWEQAKAIADLLNNAYPA